MQNLLQREPSNHDILNYPIRTVELKKEDYNYLSFHGNHERDKNYKFAKRYIL